jgi:hypothetical protein
MSVPRIAEAVIRDDLQVAISLAAISRSSCGTPKMMANTLLRDPGPCTPNECNYAPTGGTCATNGYPCVECSSDGTKNYCSTCCVA